MTQPSLLDMINKENRLCRTCQCDISHLRKQSRRCRRCAVTAAKEMRREWHLGRMNVKPESEDDIERKFQAALARVRRERRFRLSDDVPLIGSSLGGL